MSLIEIERVPPLRQGQSPTLLTVEKCKKSFLEALRFGSSVTRAAECAGMSRPTVYDWRHSDEEFAKAWDDALESGTDRLEDESFRRAHDGVNRPAFYQGQLICDPLGQPIYIKEYSDTLMCKLLAARRPSVYRERVTEVTVNNATNTVSVEISNNHIAASQSYQSLLDIDE